MAQGMMCLLYTYKYLSLDLQHFCKGQTQQHMPINLVPRGAEPELAPVSLLKAKAPGSVW